MLIEIRTLDYLWQKKTSLLLRTLLLHLQVSLSLIESRISRKEDVER